MKEWDLTLGFGYFGFKWADVSAKQATNTSKKKYLSLAAMLDRWRQSGRFNFGSAAFHLTFKTTDNHFRSNHHDLRTITYHNE